MQLSSDVKDFIESSIDLIDSNNWEKLFYQWYDDVSCSLSKDTELFEELMCALETIDPKIRKSTLYVRKDVICTYLDVEIDRLIDKWDSYSTNYIISFSDMVDNLYSHLGLTEDDFNDLYDKKDFGAPYGLEKLTKQKAYLSV